MADFDAFESSTPDQQITEEDPAAEFLAREQDQLKGLEDDTYVTENVTENVTQDQDDFDPFGGQQQDIQGSPDTSGDFFGGETTQQTEGLEGDDGFGESVDEPSSNDSYSAISQVDRQRAEPEKIRVWKEENARRIEKKDEEEKKRLSEWKDIAKKELDDWYKHHDEQLMKTKENNRQSEAAFVAERDQTQPGEEWEKICRLCEFNPKNSKNTKDISRMRSILLQLKQTPLVR